MAMLISLPARGQDTSGEQEMNLNLLVFSRTAGYRHASIEDGVGMLEKLCREHGYTMTHTEDPTAFSDETLAGYTVVIFLNTTKDVLDDTQQEAFIRYIHGGGAFVGIHAASDTEFDWPWYGRLVGAYFDGHPKIQQADIHITAPDHVCMHDLPNPWTRTDEWYNFKEVQPGLTVLAKVDESSYEGGTMGGDHPIAWCHEFEGGRSFYTALGHTPESYTEPAFIGHVHRGILWAAGVEQE
jgi:type 1 glutamine amidotransferase